MLDKSVSPLKKLIVSIGIAIMFFLIIIYAETFFLMLAKYLESAGIRSRTITRFLNSSMTYDNGRNDIFKTALSMMGILGKVHSMINIYGEWEIIVIIFLLKFYLILEQWVAEPF